MKKLCIYGDLSRPPLSQYIYLNSSINTTSIEKVCENCDGTGGTGQYLLEYTEKTFVKVNPCQVCGGTGIYVEFLIPNILNKVTSLVLSLIKIEVRWRQNGKIL